ncbi:MAG: redoxin domain-containing protein [Planctomycetia bacterium]|nr:redoxin domain-containing protein [Planctomycetia bacterium]
MKNRFWFLMVVIFLLGGMIFLESGCKRRQERRLQREMSQTERETTLPAEKQTDSPSEETVSTETTIPVAPILEGMVQAYRNAKTYRDNGEIHIFWTREGKNWERKVPYRTNLERPNQILIQVNDTLISADGTDFWAYTPKMPGMIIRRKCPAEIHLEDLLCDREIYLNLTDVETNRFSFLPAPLLLLLAEKPLETFFYGIQRQDISLLETQKIGDTPCYRISTKREEEETIFWIDQKDYVLRRVELPVEMLKEKAPSGADPQSLHLSLEFQNAELNGPGGSVSTTLALPQNVREVTNYMPRQLEFLGKPSPSFTFTTLEGKKITSESLKGKNVVLLFWASHGDSGKLLLEQLEKVAKTFPSQADVVFLAVNVESSSTTDQSLAATQNRLGSSVQVVRDQDGQMLRQFHSGGSLALFLLDAQGVVQAFDTDYHPHFGKMLEYRLQRMLQGKAVYPEVIRQMEKMQQDYVESIHRWIENGIFLDQVDLTQATVPEARISPSSEPVAFKKEELWKTSEVRTPGTILVIPRKEGASDQVFVLENGGTITELDAEGKILGRQELSLEPGNFEISLLSAEQPDGKRFFVTYGKRVHLFDENWNLKMYYPQEKVENISDLVADVLLEDLDEDGKLELYVSFWSGEGIHKVSLEGELLEKNVAAEVVFQMAVTRNPLLPGEPTEPRPLRLLGIDQSGCISILDANLKILGTLPVKERTLGWMAAYDFVGNGEDSLVTIAIAVGAKYNALGIDNLGKELWSLPLPDGVYPRPIDKIFPVRLKKPWEKQGQWLLLGADSSLHLVGMDGILIDQFNFGKIITGIASAVLQNRPVLLISTPDDVRAMEFVW